MRKLLVVIFVATVAAGCLPSDMRVKESAKTESKAQSPKLADDVKTPTQVAPKESQPSQQVAAKPAVEIPVEAPPNLAEDVKSPTQVAPKESQPSQQVAAVPDVESPAEVQPTPVAFDFQGMRIGDKLTDEFAYNHCPSKDKGKPDITGSQSIELDGKKVFVFYQFDDFKLISVGLSFDTHDFDSVAAAYTAKFGVEPHSTKTEEIQTKVGVKYTNIIFSWVTDSGEFTIKKYGSSVDKGNAMLSSPESRAYLERKRKENAEELRSKL